MQYDQSVSSEEVRIGQKPKSQRPYRQEPIQKSAYFWMVKSLNQCVMYHIGMVQSMVLL